jgi:hypothetical protein
MTSNANIAWVLAALLACGTTAAATAAEKKEARPAASSAHPVSYEELEHQIGAEISVETTLNTVRRGTLIKYTNPTLTLKLGPQMGSIDFSVPRDTVRSITLITPAPQPAEPGSDSAKKN